MAYKTKKKAIQKENLINKLVSHYGGSLHSSLVIVFFLLVLGVGLYFLADYIENKKSNQPSINNNGAGDGANIEHNFNTTIAKFQSAEEFKNYLVESSKMASNEYYAPMMGSARAPMMDDTVQDFGTQPLSEMKVNTNRGGSSGTTGRYSETNVQVAGIDEPDIIKTDGQNIFYSRQPSYIYYNDVMPMVGGTSRKIAPQQSATVDLIKSWPLADMKELASIDKNGELLVKDDILVVLSYNEINAYNIKNKEKPEKKWTLKYDNTYLGQSRLYKDKLYLITHTYTNYNDPCPIRPITINDEKVSIECVDIYHPVSPTPANSTYTVMSIDLASGKIADKISFLANEGQSAVYMSNDNIYLTYQQDIDLFTFYSDFIAKNLTDILPQIYLDKINKLKGYDISNSTKMSELNVILDNWRRSLGSDESLRIETELANRFENYYKNNQRNLANSGIVKIAVDNLKVIASGGVPGYPLNQFALDEYQGNLRIATTLGGIWGASMGSNQSTNDLYVLDKNLSIIGKVLDMGQGERIYSTRFIEDKGYVVTFRQTDPFYVLDLGDPKNPVKKGELKIPGYSSYLHPIDKNTILGIGEENNKVKISLFDVSNAADPKELYKYSLDEYWTEVNSNHKAFLIDPKYKVFFLPASRGGYILSYADNKLTLVKAAQMSQAKRAIYVNDYFYVVGDSQIKVYSEKDWSEAKAFDLLD